MGLQSYTPDGVSFLQAPAASKAVMASCLVNLPCSTLALGPSFSSCESVGLACVPWNNVCYEVREKNSIWDSPGFVTVKMTTTPRTVVLYGYKKNTTRTVN